MPARSRSSSLSRASQSLISLAESLSSCGSRLEALWWQQILGQALIKALSSRQGHPVESALDYLLDERSAAYEILVEQAEAHSEAITLSHQDQTYEAQLISAPILAWTRYQLPTGQLNTDQRQQLADLLSTTVLAPGATHYLIPELVRFDQLPQSFRDTRTWVTALAQHALGARREAPDTRQAEIPEDLLADAYFLMALVVVPQGQPLFQWQALPADDAASRASVTAQWAEGCTRIVDPLFTGCLMEYLPPEAFYNSTRQADQAIRPLTLKAAVTWLQTAAHLPGQDLRAAIVACGEQAIEEYRIGFCTRLSNDVIYGCVWPALSPEESAPDQGADGQVDTWDTLAALLCEAGIQDVRRLPGLQALEFCEDCGTPFFPNMLGEMQHPELPEEIDPEPVQFH
ncbi:DUF2863 family protein [Castellaniella sp.]|uniref:DUF2863 family protein n=1 Tax=Castellaniella sp. TaxID=1955812 RepID=UPI002AFEA19C|nr:DUF2863 family protein [Castellaniella sp.]